MVEWLLYPTVLVLTLVCCLVIGQQSLRGGYFLIAALSCMGAAEILGVPKIARADASRGHADFIEICCRWFLLTGAIGALLYVSDLWMSFDLRLLAAWLIVTPVALHVSQFVARAMFARSGRVHVSVRRAVIVGMTELGIQVERTLSADRSLQIDVTGFFDDRDIGRLSTENLHPILGHTSTLAAYVTEHHIEQVYFTLPISRDPRIVALMDELHDSTASIYFVPDLFGFDLIQARFDSVSGLPIVAVRETPFCGISSVLKRLSDVVLGVVALTVALPAILFVAIWIKADSPGPVLFKQKRYGLDGREILVYKFRSMSVTEDGKNLFKAATRADSRITRVGAFIRKTSLDELPQLFNVLEGSMSMVGPRPHPVAMNEHYRRAIPSYMVRHKVKPGITGWAQVNGYRGGDDMESMRKRIEFDLAYLRHWSVWLDVRILFRTVKVVWKDTNAY